LLIVIIIMQNRGQTVWKHGNDLRKNYGDGWEKTEICYSVVMHLFGNNPDTNGMN
jgi:hypothetical protein